jgi:hypothetical protein
MFGDPDALTDKQMDKDLRKSEWQYRLSKWSENGCLVILLVQAVLLVVSLSCEFA